MSIQLEDPGEQKYSKTQSPQGNGGNNIDQIYQGKAKCGKQKHSQSQGRGKCGIVDQYDGKHQRCPVGEISDQRKQFFKRTLWQGKNQSYYAEKYGRNANPVDGFVGWMLMAYAILREQ